MWPLLEHRVLQEMLSRAERAIRKAWIFADDDARTPAEFANHCEAMKTALREIGGWEV